MSIIDNIIGPNAELTLSRQDVTESTLTKGKTIIGVTDTSTLVTITLATVDAQTGNLKLIKDESGGAETNNNITIDVEGGGTIDGQPFITISADFGGARLYRNPVEWSVI